MRVISHRGNVDGPGSQCERKHIDNALDAGYEVEVDVWDNCGVLWVGHDKPLYPLPCEWVTADLTDRFWFHAKDRSALTALLDLGVRAFVHVDEPRAIVFPEGHIWLHPSGNASLDEMALNDAIVLDVDGHLRPAQKATLAALGVCTDWPNMWR